MWFSSPEAAPLHKASPISLALHSCLLPSTRLIGSDFLEVGSSVDCLKGNAPRRFMYCKGPQISMHRFLSIQGWVRLQWERIYVVLTLVTVVLEFSWLRGFLIPFPFILAWSLTHRFSSSSAFCLCSSCWFTAAKTAFCFQDHSLSFTITCA